MEDSFISISNLNDFTFCPYSIYLHNVYENTDESLYHAMPQVRGRIVHEAVDEKKSSSRAHVLQAISVCSEKYGLFGKIDIYNVDEECLIERKYQLQTIYQGQKYQLWAQMLCLQEMGYKVSKIQFYEVVANRTIPMTIPTEGELMEFVSFLDTFRSFNPAAPFRANPNKCRHCIYCNLCDKATEDNVY